MVQHLQVMKSVTMYAPHKQTVQLLFKLYVLKNMLPSLDRGHCWLIRSFVCNMKRPSVKQSMKWQVNSNFQIYLGKTDD